MSPDRVRTLALDGVINPVSWVGTTATRDTLQDDRLRSADGAYRALQTLLRRCDKAGIKRCSFAAGDPRKRFDAIARRLRAKPLVLGTDKDAGTIRLTYADFVAMTLGALYSPYGGDSVTSMAQQVSILLAADPKAGQVRVARQGLLNRVIALPRPGRDFPYDDSLEAFTGVMCADGLHPADASLWPALTAAADTRAPYFGRAWGWGSIACARNSWTAHDEDAYRGPFTKHTSAPVLFVGSHFDPATNYRQAVSSAKLLPNSRLLSSDNWGHTAYGTSTCVTRAVDAYLLRGTLPATGTTCHSPIQPFTTSSSKHGALRSNALTAPAPGNTAQGRPATDDTKQLPPVAGPYQATLGPAGPRR